MAIQKALSYKSIELPDAYFRVVYPKIDLTKNTMSFGVWPFPNKDAAQDHNNVLADAAVTLDGVPYDINGSNVFQQAYDHLKTTEAFAGAVDVLEDGQAV